MVFQFWVCSSVGVVSYELFMYSMLGRCRNCGVVCMLILFVGQKWILVNGLCQVDSSVVLLVCMVGKNLNVFRLCFRFRINFDLVVMFGRQGRLVLWVVVYRVGVVLGDMVKCVFVFWVVCICVGLRMVLVLIMVLGIVFCIVWMVFIVCGVCSVILIIGRLLWNSVCVICMVFFIELGVYIGIIGVSFSIVCMCGLVVDIELFFVYQGQYVSFVDRIEIIGDGMFQGFGGQVEVYSGVGIKVGQDVMQDVGCEGIVIVDVIDDVLQLVYGCLCVCFVVVQ